jgi:endonuclease/exonuclease/phosphatase family metal-dependent hydrolase
VRWWAPPGDRDRAELSRWCETVGPVFFEPLPANRDEDTIDRLAIVTWNLHVGSGEVDDLVRRLRRGEFTGGERVEQFVLLLQEAYRRDAGIPVRIPHGYPAPGRIAAGTGRGPDIRHFSRDDGFAVLYVPSMRNGIVDEDREDRGNAIVSTIPLQDPAIVELPVEHQRRAVPAAVVEGRTPAGARWRLRLADVHLDTALALMHGGPFAARRRQADALIGALAELSDSAVPITATVVAGDFNTWRGRGEPALRALRRAFPDVQDARRPPTWIGPLGIHATLDHVFVRGSAAGVDVRRLPGRFGSDHYPLIAIVSFGDATGARVAPPVPQDQVP